MTFDEKYAPQKCICYLCGTCFEDKAELKLHMADIHKQTGKHSRAIVGTAVDDNLYTCTICFEKFKTLKSYVNHSKIHANRRNGEHFEVTAFSMMRKFSLQDYVEATYGDVGQQLQTVFVCQFCGTIFSSRDSYAMHMMARVKDGTCRGPYPDSRQTLNSKFRTFIEQQKDAKTNRMETKSLSSSRESDESFQQTYFEDVIGKADEDENLQSLVGKILSSDNRYSRTANICGDAVLANTISKHCTMPDRALPNKDSLAMHVMTVRSNDARLTKQNGPLTPVTTHTNDATGYTCTKSNSVDGSPYGILSCNQCGDTFVCRDSLAMHVLIHTKNDETEKTPESVQIPTIMDLSIKRTNSDGTERGSVKRLKYGLIKGAFECGIDENVMGVIPFTAEDQNGMFQNPENLLGIKRVNMQARSKASDEKKNVPDMFKQPQFSCDICGESFEHDNERRWHFKYRHATFSEQPLCLEVVANSSKYTHPEMNQASQNMSMDVPQRMGRSVLGDRMPTLVSPKRPFSADQICQLGFAKIPMKENFVYFNEETIKILQSQAIGAKHNVVDSETENNNCREKEFANESGMNSSGNLDMPGTRRLPEVRMGSPEVIIAYDQNQPRNIAVDTSRNVEDPTNLNKSDSEVFKTFLERRNDAMICKFCEIIFFGKTVYYLHMGLHSVNNPWQCNICGVVCSGVHDFSAHVIHC